MGIDDSHSSYQRIPLLINQYALNFKSKVQPCFASCFVLPKYAWLAHIKNNTKTY